MEVITNSAGETISLGKQLGSKLSSGDVVALSGELGAGKTTFTKGLATGMGIKGMRVNSPSYVLIRQVSGGRLPLYHFDLYRLDTVRDVRNLGYEEYFYGDGVTVIEWAEKAKGLLPEEYIGIKIISRRDGKRSLKFYPKGERFKRLVRNMGLVKG